MTYELKVYENGVLLGGIVKTQDRAFADQLHAQAEDEARQAPWNRYFISVLACPVADYPAAFAIDRPFYAQKYTQVAQLTDIVR